MKSPFSEPVRVLRHGEGGVTYVRLTRFEGVGMAGGGAIWDIPTDCIPFHLRKIGSEFVAIRPNFAAEDGDTVDTIRQMCASFEVREIKADDTCAGQ